MKTEARHVIRPQPGPQTAFLQSEADIALYGGAAGGGKTWALLAEPLRHLKMPGFSAVLFRRTQPELRMSGGPWEESVRLYRLLKPTSSRYSLRHDFASGASIRMSGLELEDDKLSWQGAQITLLMFDELTSFTESQFWFLLSRNRSTCGVRPYVRATCNPDPDSFVAKLVGWWLGDDGCAIPERSGVLRWFIRAGEELVWADDPATLLASHGPDCCPRSFTFVAARLEDNQVLTKADPRYRANLMSLPLVLRERLLRGNWLVRPSSGSVFKPAWFEIVSEAPPCRNRVRAWDLASSAVSESNRDPDWTVGVLMSRPQQGVVYVEDVVRIRGTPLQVERLLLETAQRDGDVLISLPVDPGAAGKITASALSRVLEGRRLKFERPTGDKVTRAGPLASAAEVGNVKLVKGAWNDAFLNELHGFPDGAHDDQLDATASAYNLLAAARLILVA